MSKQTKSTNANPYHDQTIRSLSESLRPIRTDGERYRQEHQNAKAIHSAADTATWSKLADDNAHREAMVSQAREELRALKVRVQDLTDELRTDELDSMTWDEFKSLLANLEADQAIQERDMELVVVVMDARTYANTRGVLKPSEALAHYKATAGGYESRVGSKPRKYEADAMDSILGDAVAKAHTKTARRWLQERGNVWSTPFSKSGLCKVEHLFQADGRSTVCDKYHGGHISSSYTHQELQDLERFQRPVLCKACLRKLAKTDPGRSNTLMAMGYKW